MIVLQSYEMPLVLRVVDQETESKEILDGVKKLIIDSKGEVTEVEEWGKKTLQYQIKKQSSGNYYLIKFEADQKVIPTLNKKLMQQDNLLRFIVVKKEVAKKVKAKKEPKKA